MARRVFGWLRGLEILVATMPFLCGCGDKAMPTQSLTPTPRPTQGATTISMDFTLSRTDPPAGAKHAALAAVVVKETGGHPVSLTGMTASDYYGLVDIQVLGFVPVQLAAGQTTSFTVTLTTRQDISCSEGVDLSIFIADEKTADRSVGCENTDWPF